MVVVDPWKIPTPFPVGPVNAYYLPGRRPALVDAGPRTPEAQAALAAYLRDHPVEVLVVTHEHVDHAGLARWLQRDHGVRVLLHHREARALERWDEDAPLRQEDYEEGLRAAAVPTALRERLRYGGRAYDRWGESVHADETFEGGDRVLLGDREFEVVDAPGHTPGSHLLSDGEVTFTGDTILEQISPNALSVRASERGGLQDYWATLHRLAARDWATVHPGHGRPFAGAADVLRRGLLHAERRQARVLGAVAPDDVTAFEVVQRVFPGLPEDQLFLAVSEILGHLEVLTRAGRLLVRRVDHADQYRRAPTR